jgi:hypothetical protein
MKRDDELRSLFSSNVTLQEITEEVIAHFVGKGAKREDILFMRGLGMKYCPERDSFVSEPIIFPERRRKRRTH